MAATLAMATAGCGSESAAMDEGETADTARFELVITRTGREGRLVMSGSYDYVRREGALTGKLEGTKDADTDVPTEVRFFGDRAYIEMEHEDKSYWTVDEDDTGIGYPDEAIIPSPEGELDPKEALRVILAAGDEQERGREEVRGDSTTHYRVKLAPKDVSRELGGRRLDAEAGPFTADVWADDAGRVRRIRIDEDGTLTYEFFDFGVEVDVDRPTADEVITQAEFDKLTEPTDEELFPGCLEELPREECERMHEDGP